MTNEKRVFENLMWEKRPVPRSTEARVTGALFESLALSSDGVIPKCPRFHQRAEGSRAY